MTYYKRNLWILAAFNLFIAAARITKNFTHFGNDFYTSPWLVILRTLEILLMAFLLILIAKNRIRIRLAAGLSAGIIVTYVLTVIKGRGLENDTLLNIAMMVIIYSFVSIQQCYHEEQHLKKIAGQPPVELDLRISDRSQLFHPLVIGPHLEIHPEITEAVDRFLRSGKTPAPLILNIHCSTVISRQLQDTAIESFQDHYRDEQRRLGGILEKRTRRSMILFCISMSIMFVWVRYNDFVGDSAVWTILGNMGGFFLWEIGNTHLRHIEDHAEFERTILAENANIIFLNSHFA